MTANRAHLEPNPFLSGRQWRALEHQMALGGATYRLRLVRFAAGCLASVDTVEGPTLGYDRSPYMAIARAIEPLGGSLLDAMSIVSPLRRSHQISAASSVVLPLANR